MGNNPRMAVLAADAFQDSEYFLPKIEIERMGLRTEVVSLGTKPIEIYSLTGFHLADQFPDLVIRPAVEASGGIWVEDQPAVVDRNLISSRHPDDMSHFTAAIAERIGNGQ
jgi:putative intracellular protease/amidase